MLVYQRVYISISMPLKQTCWLGWLFRAQDENTIHFAHLKKTWLGMRCSISKCCTLATKLCNNASFAAWWSIPRLLPSLFPKTVEAMAETSMIYPSKMVILHSFLYVYQRGLPQKISRFFNPPNNSTYNWIIMDLIFPS
jgi:hypothetical protein